MISAKNDGVMPGFTVRDSAARSGSSSSIRDIPPWRRARRSSSRGSSGASGITSGHLATLSIDQLTIDEQARITPPSGKSVPSRCRTSSSPCGGRTARRTDRAVWSPARRSGRVIGGFRFYDTRSDDPNDVIPHEHRRELRGYGTFAAWLNHVDSKSINTLDTVVEQDGRQVVRHHLLDFGSAIGSAGVYPRATYEGWEYLVEGKKTLAGMPSFGFYIKDWRTMPVYGTRGRSVSRSTTAVGSRVEARATPIPRSVGGAWTTSSGPRGGSRRSPTRC